MNIQSSKLVRKLGPLAACLLIAFMFSGCIYLPLTGPPAFLSKVEIQSSKQLFFPDEIMIVDCSGTLDSTDSGLFFKEPSALERITDQLLLAERDPRVKAIILRIDSPGGTVTASDMIYHQIMELKKRRKAAGNPIAVTAAMMDVAASGGYYIAMAADKVYAHPTTITGSIGVIMIIPGVEGLSDKLGVDWRVFKSGKNKDIGSFFRSMPREDRRILQSSIDVMYERFVDIVSANRTELSREEIKTLADGRPYLATEALEHGLIDGVMHLDEMIAATEKLAGIEDARVVMRRYDHPVKGNLYARHSFPVSPRANLKGLNPGGANPYAAGAANINLFNIDLGSLGLTTAPKLLYLYQR